MIFIVAGPGGVGKGTVVKKLLELCPELYLSRSWTTRARRLGEAEDAYVFVDEDTFRQRVEDGGFLEWTRFRGTGKMMGTPRLDVPSGKDVVLEIDLVGAQQVKGVHPDAILILVLAPSPEDQRERLERRGDSPVAVARRLEVGAEEEELGRLIADHVVVNDDVDRAATEVAAIIRRRGSGD